jgi:phosphatidate cytidylyltransferase
MVNISQERQHLERWITAAVALPLLVAAVALGPRWLLSLLIVVVSVLGLAELGRLLLPEAPVRARLLLLSGGLVLPLATHWLGLSGLAASAALLLFASFLPFLFATTMDREILRSLGSVAFAQLYIPFTMSHVILLFRFPQGRRWIFFVFLVIFAGDTGAFYSGRMWGRHLLAPIISPKKTIEGALGGLAVSLIVAVLAGKLLNPASFRLGSLLILGLTLALVGQLGDLMESMIKRASRVKDAGTLLPGHGGMLDRLDSLVFAFPLTYYFAFFLT